jgi:hypothetical protein
MAQSWRPAARCNRLGLAGWSKPCLLTAVAVGTQVTPRPRSDPYVWNYRIRLLPQVITRREALGLGEDDKSGPWGCIVRPDDRSAATSCASAGCGGVARASMPSRLPPGMPRAASGCGVPRDSSGSPGPRGSATPRSRRSERVVAASGVSESSTAVRQPRSLIEPGPPLVISAG